MRVLVLAVAMGTAACGGELAPDIGDGGGDAADAGRVILCGAHGRAVVACPVGQVCCWEGREGQYCRAVSVCQIPLITPDD